jgi:anti-sigma factor RsiW
VTCREFVDFILSYLEGELDEPQRAAFDYHLSGCRNCVRYLDHYRRTLDAERAAFADEDAPVPDEVPEALVQAILAATRR